MVDIRQFQPDDMFSVIHIAYKSLPEQYNPIVFNQFYENFQSGFLVAEQNHKIIGFIVGIKTLGNTAKILMLAVTKQYRRKNIGSLLLTSFINEIQHHQISTIELEVRTQNIPAQQFYKKHGFFTVDIISKFYQNGEDAFLMSKKI